MEQESSNITQTSDQIQTTSGPADLLQKISSDSKIKTVNFTVPFRKDISLIDFSINSQGQDEDKIYALTQWYRHNVRRGNTIIQTFDEERKVQETFIGRKGFEKFFDLSYEYLQYNIGEIKDLNIFGMGSLDEHHGLYDAIFAKASQVAQENHKIAVYKLGKANGENAQVSWIEGLGAWLIASKNVSLLARNEEDVKGYNGDRFNYAKMIAKEWFKIVDRIEKDGQIEALKEYMKVKTLVGELCGNQEYQHLVRYTTMQIFFVAIVENNSDITCLSPSEAIAAFDKFNLAHVKYQEMGIYSNWNDLNEALKKIYVDVAKANLDSEEEGAVIYLVKVSDNQREETLSLSKLKTLEYRIYRKLREKLKAFSGHKKRSDRPWKEFYNQYCEETQSLCKEIKPPMPLEFYFHIAREAFAFAEKNPKKYYIIQSQYITFISMLLYTLNKGEKLNSAAFDDKTTVQTVLGIPWTEHYQAYKPPAEDEKMLIENNKPDSARKKVRVVVPIGIPGMGKTYFLNMFTKVVKENGCELSVISSDAIRKECMDKLAKSNKRLKTDQLYDKTGRDAKNLFNDRLRDLISQAKKKNSRGYFIFIDKNHPPNAIKGTIDFIYNSANSQVDVELIALVPQMEGNLLSYEDQGKQHNYPFSPNFFFNCFSRVQSRKAHETLTGAGAKSADVMIMFLQMFRNIQLDKAHLAQNGFHKLFSIPFTAETAPTNIPAEIQEVCFEVLKATQPGDKCKDQKLIAKLNDIYESHALQFLHPEPNLVEESVNRFFQEEIIPELPARNENNEDNNKLEVEERKEDKDEAFENDAKDEYNPSRLPLYLGIFAHGHPVAQVKEYVLKCLDLLVKAFPQDNVLEDISKDLTDNKPNELDFTSDFHITSLFIGKNERLRESKYFKTFKPRHQMHIEIAGFIIVPGKIATAICYPDDSPIQIQNKFPHVTIMKGKWAPKFSNDVLEAIFGEDGPLKGKYQKEEFSNLQEFTHKTSVRISCGSGIAYIVMVSPHLRLSAEARSSDDVPS